MYVYIRLIHNVMQRFNEVMLHASIKILCYCSSYKMPSLIIFTLDILRFPCSLPSISIFLDRKKIYIYLPVYLGVPLESYQFLLYTLREFIEKVQFKFYPYSLVFFTLISHVIFFLLHI